MTDLRPRPAHAAAAIALLTVALAGVSVGAVLVAPAPWQPLREVGFAATVAIFLAFVVAELSAFDLEYRREAVAFSLSEIPTAFALIFLSPFEAVATRVLAMLLALIIQRRTDPTKLFFNLALFAFEVAASMLAMRVILEWVGSNSSAWVIAVTALVLLMSSSMSSVILAIPVSLLEGGYVVRLRQGFAQAAPIWLLGSLLGATSIAPALASPWLFVIPLLPCVIVWRLLTSRGQLAQRHRDLSEVHDFTRAIGRSVGLPDVIEAAQAESRRLLRAQHAALVVFDEHGQVLAVSATAQDNAALPSSVVDERWAGVLDSVEPWRLLATDTTLPGSLLVNLRWTEALAVTIRDSQGLIGLLLLGDRAGGLIRFSDDDQIRLRPIADQLSVSIRRAMLHVQMEHDVTHDRLTGLPNRAMFEQLATESLTHHGRTAVFLLDLDRFKEVNDGLGHHVGDQLLQAFARRVTSILGPNDVLARLAGDEFAVLSRGTTDQYAIRVGMEIVERGRHTFDIGDLSVAVSCSIGLAMGPIDGGDPETLLRRADLAMYKAKSRSSGLEMYTADLEAGSSERLELLRDLREVIASGDLDVFFQPKVNLVTEEVVGAEALVRWQHPQRGLLEAETFIKLMEATDLVHSLADHVLTQALRAARDWRSRGWQIGVAVNISARTLLDELLADRIARHLAHHGLEPGILTIEITETSVMTDVSRALGTLHRLDDLGVKLSVDDFGTGYSSLTYLRRLPVSELKIERAFVAGMLNDKHDHVIVKSTIELGSHLGLSVVAEGVEDDLVARRLRDLGCTLAQGRGFAPAMPLALFNTWVTRQMMKVERAKEAGRKGRWESA